MELMKELGKEETLIHSITRREKLSGERAAGNVSLSFANPIKEVHTRTPF